MKNKTIVKRTLIKILIYVVFIIFMIMPIIMMYKLSKSEQEKYVQDKEYVYKEMAYGEIEAATRMDIEQYYLVEGYNSSSKYEYIDISTKSNDLGVEVLVECSEEVVKNQVIARVNGKDIVSVCNGIVCDIDDSSNNYIKIKSLDALELICNVDKKIADSLRKINILKLEDGKKVNVKKVSNAMEDGKIQIVLEIEDNEYMYGEEVNNLKVYTGRVLNDVLVVSRKAIYIKADGKYYVRTVDKEGVFAGEVEIGINYEADDFVGVTGIEEGTYCDLGYSGYIATNNAEE